MTSKMMMIIITWLNISKLSSIVDFFGWDPIDPAEATARAWTITDPEDEQCPKKVKVVAPTKVSDDGVVEANVNGEASTSQPKENKEPYAQHPNNNGKDVSELHEINIVSNDVRSIMNDSDSEEVENVFVEDNRKPMDDMVDDAQKNVEAPPKKTYRKTGIWSGRKSTNVAFSPETIIHYFDRDDIDEMKHDNAYSKKG
uniref:Uncharacterized protein n=1 Tax=Tanacetum cinerariifolium TaxID=118510 RepID=A0A6L2JZ21_TANCI|nr:hypothetical protein [Tanacetum cinerariifolium]